MFFHHLQHTCKYTVLTYAEIHSSRQDPYTPDPVLLKTCNRHDRVPGIRSPLPRNGCICLSSGCQSTHYYHALNSLHLPFLMILFYHHLYEELPSHLSWFLTWRHLFFNIFCTSFQKNLLLESKLSIRRFK